MTHSNTQINVHDVDEVTFDDLSNRFPQGEYLHDANTYWFVLKIPEAEAKIVWFKENR